MPRRPFALQVERVVLAAIYWGVSLTGSEAKSSSCFRFRPAMKLLVSKGHDSSVLGEATSTSPDEQDGAEGKEHTTEK